MDANGVIKKRERETKRNENGEEKKLYDIVNIRLQGMHMFSSVYV